MSQAQDDARQVDHRYSPPWWQTLICLPDDPVKTLVGREGQFFLDYGSGGPRNFQTSLGFDLVGGGDWIGQELPVASTPVLITRKRTPGVTIEETAFLEIPGEGELPPKLVRYDGFETLTEWAHPTVPCDPAFRDAAVRYPSGSHEASLELHLHVKPHTNRTVALGFCEGRHTAPGLRRAIALVEGSEPREIDPVRDFGPNTPGVYLFHAADDDGDGRILISLKYHPDTHFSVDSDRIADLRTIMLSALWSFTGEAPDPSEIVRGTANSLAEVYASGHEMLLPHRRNHVCVRLTNETVERRKIEPMVRIVGIQEPFRDGSVLKVGPHNLISCSLSVTGIVEVRDDRKEVRSEHLGIQGSGGAEWHVSLACLDLGPGETQEVSLVLDRFARHQAPFADPDVSRRALAMTSDRWLAIGPGLHMIQIPDEGVQRMVDSSIRNIFQARDIRNGLPSFHVGPTVYRGLFLADGAFLLEVATLLDRVSESRQGLAYLRSFELPEGGFSVIDTYYKENGIAVFAIIRHAQLTNDPDWLRSNWSTIQGCVKRIQKLRRLPPKGAPNEGLLPAGAFCDGGVFNNGRPYADYSNVAWCLSGLKWAAQAATWIGETEDARIWGAEFDDFMATFRTAASKDLIQDVKGNTYLPVVQGNGDNHEPQRGQWAFCHSVYPGGIYEPEDPIVCGNMDMLRDAMIEGVVIDTGWMSGGLWPYFSSFYAHALLWMGRGSEVPQVLYDFANHSSPTLVWREEQKPQGKGYEEVGDMPHNWASGEFLRMVIHMLQLDRGDELHLLQGYPAKWSAPGLTTHLQGIRTPFGKIDLLIEGVMEGVRIRLDFADPNHLPRRIVVHRDAWGGSGEVELPVEMTIDEVTPRNS